MRDHTADQDELERIWATGPGIGRLAAVNHHVIGLRFILTSLAFFAIGGLLAMLLRVQLATPDSAFLPPGRYAQVFTVHGTVMMFLFAIPLLEGLAMVLLPKMLGARDLAFPRLSAFGYWCYLFGGLILLTAMGMGLAPDAGWFLYPPLSSSAFSPGIGSDLWLLGITFVEISAIAAAVELTVSVLLLRAPGMRLMDMPIMVWTMLVVGAMMLLGFPPLIVASTLLEAERTLGVPFFDPARGGDPLLWQHLFWSFGHPEVYVMFLPAAAVISTIVPVFARRPLVAHRWVIGAILSVAGLSFLLWGHHMFTAGIHHGTIGLFSAASLLVAIPTGVQLFAWIATLARASGRPKGERLPVPMLWVLGFFFTFTAGGLTGVMLAVVPFDLQAHDTHFVVAHMHYVLLGGFVFPMVAALYHWLPLVTGRRPEGWLSRAAFWLTFLGMNATFGVMHLTGLLGMPRRVASYAADAGWTWPNLVSSAGSFVMAAGFAAVFIDLLLSTRFARRSPPDPWRGATLEWATPTLPPAPHLFDAIPAVKGHADALHPRRIAEQTARGDGYLSLPRNGWMETMGVHPVTAEPEQVILLPARSFRPLWSALVLAATVMAVLAKSYTLAAALAVLAVAILASWPPHPATSRDHGSIGAGQGTHLPPHTEHPRSPLVYGLRTAIAADAAALASLAFACLYLTAFAPNWDAAPLPQIPTGLQLVTAGSLIGAVVTADKALRRGRKAMIDILGAFTWNLAVLLTPIAMMQTIEGATTHAAPATHFALYLWLCLHGGIGSIIGAIAIARRLQGRISDARRTDMRLLSTWNRWQAVTGIVVLAFPHASLAIAG